MGLCLIDSGWDGRSLPASERLVIKSPASPLSQCHYSILVSAGKVATTWSERGIALGGSFLPALFQTTILPNGSLVIAFTTLLHGFMPRTGVYIMNVRYNHSFCFCIALNNTIFQLLSTLKILILIFVVITGWVVLSGKTHISNPEANFANAFVGSSHSGGDVSVLYRW